jgi:integrase
VPKKNLFGLSADSRGRWRRQNLGARPDGSKPTFLLGTDYAQACKRAVLLDKVWETVEQNWAKKKPTPFAAWDEATYAIALAVCRGEATVKLTAPQAIENTAAQFGPEGDEFVALWLKGLQEQFPFVALALADGERQERGAASLEAWASSLNNFAQRVLTLKTSHMLHAALDGYVEQRVRPRYTDGNGVLSQFGKLVLKRVGALKGHHEDVALSRVDGPFLENLVLYWCKRPRTKFGKPCSREWALGVIKTLRDFVRWLHRAKAFDWKKPDDYEVTAIRVAAFPEELMHEEVKPRFTKGEVATLYEYARGVERLLLLLGLNCGFGQAEVATLKLSEVSLDNGLVRRVRTKTGAPGKWALWGVTVGGLRWYLDKVRPQSDSPFLFLTREGKRFDALTKGNNRSQHIPNQWGRLLARVRKDKPDFRKLSFNKLRKTSSNWVRRRWGKEVADAFLADGKRERVDAYTERRWADVLRACRWLGKKLAGSLSAVTDPWPAPVGKKLVPNTSVSPGTIKRMQTLRNDGYTTKKIAELVGVSITTVLRYTRKPAAKPVHVERG